MHRSIGWHCSNLRNDAWKFRCSAVLWWHCRGLWLHPRLIFPKHAKMGSWININLNAWRSMNPQMQSATMQVSNLHKHLISAKATACKWPRLLGQSAIQCWSRSAAEWRPTTKWKSALVCPSPNSKYFAPCVVRNRKDREQRDLV